MLDVQITNGLTAAFISSIIVLITGPYLIPYLTRLKVGQVIRDDGPQRHLTKAGTPTMGGLMFILGITVAALTLGWNQPYILAALTVMLLHGAIGFRDDYIKVVLKRSMGLNARQKLGFQLLISLALAIFLAFGTERGTGIILPITGDILELGYAYYLLIAIVILGTSNAVNLTDGLDGLASGATLWVVLAYAAIAWIGVEHSEIGMFSMALAGGCLGFLYYNRHPAKVFMGDTGSMALGGAVAAIAILTRTELFLVIIGGLYVLEALSDIIQVGYFKATGNRVFRMAPLHHHFELGGWKETSVVHFFWLLSFLFSVTGAVLYYYSI